MCCVYTACNTQCAIWVPTPSYLECVAHRIVLLLLLLPSPSPSSLPLPPPRPQPDRMIWTNRKAMQRQQENDDRLKRSESVIHFRWVVLYTCMCLVTSVHVCACVFVRMCFNIVIIYAFVIHSMYCFASEKTNRKKKESERERKTLANVCKEKIKRANEFFVS